MKKKKGNNTKEQKLGDIKFNQINPHKNVGQPKRIIQTSKTTQVDPTSC